MQDTFKLRLNAISGVLAVAFGLGTALTPAHAADGAWTATATQAMPLKNFTGIRPMLSSSNMRVTVGLHMRNKAELDSLVAEINKPGSPQFGHVLTPQQFVDRYAPSTAQVTLVTDYLKAQGFHNIEVSDNRMSVSASGTSAIVSSAFNTQLVEFPLAGKTVFANNSPAQVPASLQGVVAAVVGLQNMSIAKVQVLRDLSSKPAPAVAVAPKASTATSPIVAAPTLPQDPLLTPPYSGPQYQIAYNAGSTSTGWGTAIAIVTEGDITQVPIDLRTYEAEFGLPQVPYEIVPVGLQTTDVSGLDEWDLDSQSSSGIAGNLREIIFYNAGSLGDADLIPDYNKIVSDNRVKAVNMSFGGCETLEYLSGGMLLADLAYEQGAAQGITFFASSGDGGASCQLVANAGEPVVVGAVEYPASSPYVVAVGGTSLLTNADYTYNLETAWVSGGGGISLWEAPGVWTSGVIPVVNTTAGQRAVPDIAMVGDPNEGGADVVVNGVDTGVGGTSLSSPLSVGVWSRMQSGHGNCYGFAAPIFYTSFGQPFGTAALDFHDIILGDNYLYPALPGWDYTTGLGSFNITAVNNALPPITCVPQAPYGLTAGLVSGQVLLHWTGTPGATSYAIFDGTASGAEGSTAIATSTSTSTVINGLARGKTFYFTVKAIDSVGSSGASNEASIAIPTPPPAPTSLAGTAGNGQATLTWKASTGATSYNVYQGTTAGAESTTPIMTGITSTTATVTGLTNGSTYYFVVTAVNGGGPGAKSNEAKVVLAPSAPASVKAVTGTSTGSVVVSWGASAGAASYNVYSGTASNGESSTPAVSGTKTTSATLTGLVSKKVYYFQVTAVGSTGAISVKSLEVSAAAK